MGSDESHFNVSLLVRSSHKTISTNHNLFEEKGEPMQNTIKLYCIKMGSDESHFNVSLLVRSSHKTISTNHNLFEEKGEPMQN